MSKVDINISFYGKPYQAIVTIESLLKHSGQHIDKIYIQEERNQPHNEWQGIFKVLDAFRNRPDARIVVHRPKYYLGLGVSDYDRAQADTDFRQSILYQYALEKTDKKYMCVMHNDILFHDDMIGQMLKDFENGPKNLAGVGSIGQCWVCPAAIENRCNSKIQHQVSFSQEEVVAMYERTPVTRKEIGLRVAKAGRYWPMPECRLNEYVALIDMEAYRPNTLPVGDLGCYGGGWSGCDQATIWSHDMVQRGYVFQNIVLEDYAKHAPFDETGSGTIANTRQEIYFGSEHKAKAYIEKHYYATELSSVGQIKVALYRMKRVAAKIYAVIRKYV
jgi:hypothetical protein